MQLFDTDRSHCKTDAQLKPVTGIFLGRCHHSYPPIHSTSLTDFGGPTPLQASISTRLTDQLRRHRKFFIRDHSYIIPFLLAFIP